MKRLLLIATLCCFACEPRPPVVPTADPQQSTQLSHIDGTVVVQSQARGNAVVFLFDATKPPPPAGTGRPLAFSFVPESQLFTGGAGPFSAPFSFSLVPPGAYLIQGFIDLDGCLPAPVGCRKPHFIPWFSVTNEPEAGDVGGGAVDPVTLQPSLISIPSGTLTPAEGISVGFSDQAVFPVDRPIFSVNGSPLFDTTNGSMLELDADPMKINGVNEAPVFLAKWVAIVNGAAQDVDGDPSNGPDFWPKVIVRKASDTNPLQDDSTTQVALAAGIDPVSSGIAQALTDSNGNPIPNAVPVTKLNVVIKPGVYFDVTNPSSPQVKTGAIPAGFYAIYVVEFTGQTWRVPNELTPAFGPKPVSGPLGFGDAGVPSQGFLLQVP